MKKIIITALALVTLSVSSRALTLDGYEKLSSQIQSNSKDVEVQKAMLNTYLTAVAETLTSLRGADGKISLNKNESMCISKEININADFVKKFAEEPLKKPAQFRGVFGEGWKDIVLTDYITGIMMMAFKCN
ncbi:MAG: hypothetical protein A2Z90_08290 [Burkholderiales bacterium GWA2_64_37]|nr:MAG: hypothetical protein A2Z90_08290 [Burkholderiales bacterium GWA2_64_37]HCE95049.1 hypothetical protein [Acidovorax sp.]